MPLPTRTEIELAWKALSADVANGGWRSIEIATRGVVQLRAARQFPGNAEALLIGFKAIDLPQPSLLPQGKGFRVERTSLDELGENNRWLAMVRLPQGPLDLFTMMATDIVGAMSSIASSDELRFFQLFLGRIRAWQEFMKKGHEGLSPEAELGLIGELECLNALLDTGLPPSSILDGWTGPEDGLQDFILGCGAIEVKSTLSSEGFPATIMSLEQLDDAVLRPMFVCGCRFALDQIGKSLPERINLMSQRLSTDITALHSFETALLHVGYLDLHAENYSRKFILGNMTFWILDDDFPRLICGNVPTGIRRVRYEIDLDSVLTGKTALVELIKMIGMI